MVNYKARIDQREKLFSLISCDNYNDMQRRLSELSNKDSVIGSSNFLELTNNLENANDEWIDIKNKAIL